MSPNRDSVCKPSFEASSFRASDVDDDDHSSNMTLLHEDRHKPGGTTATNSRRSRLSRRLTQLVAGVVVLASLGALAYTAAGVHRLSGAATADYGDCGTSETVAEARAHGCVFDPMSWIWVRPECYDPDLVAEFMAQTNFSWHTEPKLRPETRVDMDIIYRGDFPKLFTQKDYHTVHCFVSSLGGVRMGYMMKKMHKAILEHRPIDSYLTEWHHTNHCGMVMLNDIMHQDVACTAEMVCPTWVRATWTSCRRY
ncbi:hypothetical protein QBC47DRAFT_165074 [Echria macrotheca]|uniref:Uncharacterized protein n=1 Tax=Echria macrotheca TaxID=438768 RepID=A0AAJ0BGX8_9PEZI|nr:hypothetical protein QBC47DRAFT_165074 [Echria macrotheca]